MHMGSIKYDALVHVYFVECLKQGNLYVKKKQPFDSHV